MRPDNIINMQKNDTTIWPDSYDIGAKHRNDLRLVFEQILSDEKIPLNAKLKQNFTDVYLPLTLWLLQQQQNTPVVIGINGSQGSGKSTLSRILSALLTEGFDKKVTVISIDDLYKTRHQREQMSRNIHPLFATRGVPGTHDIELGLSILSELKQGNKTVKLPQFDKASDDRKNENNWPESHANTDIILFEGWCVGSIAQPFKDLATAINTLEQNHDSDLIWRQTINQQLENEYQLLFAAIDKLIMLKIPDFKKVTEWRTLQEHKLKQSTQLADSGQIMSAKKIQHFVMHFERLTRHTLTEMPERADIVLEINNEHQIADVHFKHD